jgi:hypothetical protein
MRIVCTLILLASASCTNAATLIHAARIHTMDPEQPQVQSLLLDETGRISARGDFDALRAAHPQARVVDLGERTVVPGLIDAHGHVLNLGLSLQRADLVGTTSKAQIIERLQAAEKALPKDAWLLGRGWDQNDWEVAVFPSAADLDAAFPKRPVLLERVDGHAAWANSAALAKVKQDLQGDWQPDGGRIERIDGKATGVFVDGASLLVEKVVPTITTAQKRAAYLLAFEHLLAAGLTGVHDAGTSLEDLQLLRSLADDGKLPLRISAMADGDSAALDQLCRDGIYAHESGRLQMRTVKLYADGALGSRGAALLADYSDQQGNRGLLVTAPTALGKAMEKAQRCGVQVATHAIGDRANRQVLDRYTDLLQNTKDARWRVEHAQLLAPADLGRMAKLQVIASMQPTHATSDMPWAALRVGPQRIVGAYAWRTLRDLGTPLALGSDFPVESAAPRLGLHAAVTRQDIEGKPAGGWFADQRLSVYEALRGFTRDAAWAGFAETQVGMLRAGYRADFTVFEQDPQALQPTALHTLKVSATWVDGKPAHTAP